MQIGNSLLRYFSDTDFTRQVFNNVLGGAIVASIPFIINWSKKHIKYRRLRAIFGEDIVGIYHLVYAELTHVSGGNLYQYKKKGNDNFIYSASSAVSISEAISIAYLTKTIALKASSTPSISSDEEIDKELDISFVSFGFTSNNKTIDVLENKGNKYLQYNQEAIRFSLEHEYTVEPGKHYGFILKIHPTQFNDRVWIACGGYGEWGTSGSAWFLANKWQILYKKAKNKPFAALIKVNTGKDQSAELVAVNTDEVVFPKSSPSEKNQNVSLSADCGSAVSGAIGSTLDSKGE